ncbi:class I SAM-dependent methyltransferase [Rhodoferax sp. WC2427]|uniref:class I SAM-dependent methyltransferase n=1 Tax=Rhodoferax sp. WC2427 TaxID=3234144 RepID=UPI0034674740
MTSHFLHPTPSRAAKTGIAAHCDLAIRILERLLRGYSGNVSLRLWDDRLHELGMEASAFTLVLRDPSLLRRIIAAPSPVLLADAYFRGELDVEGDLYSALALKAHFESLVLPWRDKISLLLDAWRLSAVLDSSTKSRRSKAIGVAEGFSHTHSRRSDQSAIAFHYDVSNEFYGLWLDTERVYSCAYFETEHDSLDRAQRNKLEHICRKLRLRPGEYLLDIGCGWGALVCWAARHHGVRAHGITLSQRQFDYASKRIASEGLQDRVTVELRDYRDLGEQALYDKVASIGMFEHVGLANLPTYFATVQQVLRPGGLFLNHGITHDEEGWNQTVATEFINRYVFPDGEFDCVSNIQLGMERAGFEIEDVEALRRHYALTLRHWVQRLEENRTAALGVVDEATFRIWRLYMAACALEFEAGGTGIYQILASRRGAATSLPLTRKDLYR